LGSSERPRGATPGAGAHLGGGEQRAAMKVTLKYEEGDRPELHMTLRLQLPQKYVNGPTKEVVKLFVDHYNKKHTESQLDCEALHLKIVGGNHLEHDSRVRDTMAHGDECYLLGDSASRPAAKRAAPSADAAAAPASQDSAGAERDADGKKVMRDEKGRIRCKRFGCKQFYDPDGPEQKCIYHKAPPIFHETAKWWSCCPDRKAYDWEEFMRIPGCQTGVCSATPEGQKDMKKFLGGSDLRGDNAPVRLDADAPKDPRHKLAEMMQGLVAIGVDKALFEKVWSKLASQTDDLEKVCDTFRARFTAVLNSADA